GDIETLIAPGPVDANAFMATVNRISPKGRTPLSAAVKQAADVLSYQSNPATVVLISDGVENCEADPCALATELAEQGVAFTTHVVDLDIETEPQDDRVRHGADHRDRVAQRRDAAERGQDHAQLE